MGNRYVKIKHPNINKKVPKNAPAFVLEFARLIKNRHGTLHGKKKKYFCQMMYMLLRTSLM